MRNRRSARKKSQSFRLGFALYLQKGCGFWTRIRKNRETVPFPFSAVAASSLAISDTGRPRATYGRHKSQTARPISLKNKTVLATGGIGRLILFFLFEKSEEGRYGLSPVTGMKGERGRKVQGDRRRIESGLSSPCL
jgi:hypothetical protein